jgi:hypothetical protein
MKQTEQKIYGGMHFLRIIDFHLISGVSGGGLAFGPLEEHLPS